MRTWWLYSLGVGSVPCLGQQLENSGCGMPTDIRHAFGRSRRWYDAETVRLARWLRATAR